MPRDQASSNTQTLNKPIQNTETFSQAPLFSGEVGHCPGFLRGCFGVYTKIKLVVLIEFRVSPGPVEDRLMEEAAAQCEMATFSDLSLQR